MKQTILILTILGLTLDLFAQDDFAQKLEKAAIEITRQKVSYDPTYFRIDYPNGDVPGDKGVCMM